MTKVRLSILKGGASSGNFDHAGRPGKVGGSQPKGNGKAAKPKGKVNKDIINNWEEDVAFVWEMREADAEGVSKPYHKPYQELMNSVDALPNYDGTVYRGINEVDLSRTQMLNKYSKGKIIEIHAISSSTKNLDTATFFSKTGLDFEKAAIVDLPDETAIVLKLSIKGGKDIGKFSSMPEQQEVLIKKGASFKITSALPMSKVVDGQRRKYLSVKGVQR